MSPLPAGATFIESEAYFEEWKRSKAAKEHLEKITAAVAVTASELAPDDPSTGPDEDLHGSIRGEAILTDDGYIGRVKALNWKAAWYEFGNSRTPAHPYLRPAAEAHGLKFTKRG
jgi:hypothetical protein